MRFSSSYFSLQYLAAAATTDAKMSSSFSSPRGYNRGRHSCFSDDSSSGGDPHLRSVNTSRQVPRRPQYYRQQQQPPFFQPPPIRPRYYRPPDYRNWEYALSQPPSTCERFSVLSYNILADYLAINHRRELYAHIPKRILDWEWRKRKILFEFGLWSPDIMCLQEVDKFQDLEAELMLYGYNGIWKMRTGIPVDGCAIFWRTTRFTLVHEESIEYNKLGLRDNVAQICVLESRNQHGADIRSGALPQSSNGANQVVICNTHVLYNPKRGEIKLGQVRVLLDRAHAVSKLWNDAPVIICGDFNCTPKSPLYNFISERKLDFTALARDQLSGQSSAQIRTAWPYTPYPGNSSLRVQIPDSSNQAAMLGEEKEVSLKQSDSMPNMHTHNKPNNDREGASFTDMCATALGTAQDLIPPLTSCVNNKFEMAEDRHGGQPSDSTDHSFPGTITEHSQSNSQMSGLMASSTHVLVHENMDRETLGLKENVTALEGNNYESKHDSKLKSDTVQDITSDLADFSFSEDMVPLSESLGNSFHELITDEEKANSSIRVISGDQSSGSTDQIIENEDRHQSSSYTDQSFPGTLTKEFQSNLCASVLMDSTMQERLGHDDGTDNGIAGMKEIVTSFESNIYESRQVSNVEKATVQNTSSDLVPDTTFTDDIVPLSESFLNSSLELLTSEENASLSASDQIVCEVDIFSLPTCVDSNKDQKPLSENKLGEVTEEDGRFGQAGTSTLSSEVCRDKDVFNYDTELDYKCVRPEEGEKDQYLEKHAIAPQTLQVPSCDENQGDSSLSIDSGIAARVKNTYDPSSWTPMEIETASGNAECNLLEHPLKLRSTYADIEDFSGTRDSSKEPQVTSYNRRFMGTVDYIWCSEGLKTVKVLDTIPKHALQWTPGFPTPKWGSDHIALVSQLAFTKGTDLS